jgi:hypothetical protein
MVLAMVFERRAMVLAMVFEESQKRWFLKTKSDGFSDGF